MPQKLPLLFIASMLAKATAAQHAPTPPMDSATRNNVLQSVQKAITNYYVFRDKAAQITAHLETRVQAYGNSNPADLAERLTKDIRTVHNDKHLRIEYDPKLEADIIKFIASPKGAQEVAKADSLKDVKHNFYFKRVEVLPSNIGYIEFTNFATPNAGVRKAVQAAMQFVSNTDALVIDLRNNFGGNGTTAGEILGYFFPTKTRTGKVFNRLENKWSEAFIENKRAVTGGLVLSMPIYLLTSSRTYSAAEGFAYTLQQLKGATVIGDTTRGGAHLTRSFSLGNGFVGFIPYLRTEYTKTGTNWEGIGVIPNITAADGKELITAQKTVLANQLAITTNETERRKLTWLINYYSVQTSPVAITTADYEGTVGRFAEFEISIRDGQLFFRDVNQRTVDYKKMIPITPTLFQVERDYQVEIVQEADGKYNAIKMYWDDGWMEVIKRGN